MEKQDMVVQIVAETGIFHEISSSCGGGYLAPQLADEGRV